MYDFVLTDSLITEEYTPNVSLTNKVREEILSLSLSLSLSHVFVCKIKFKSNLVIFVVEKMLEADSWIQNHIFVLIDLITILNKEQEEYKLIIFFLVLISVTKLVLNS